MYKAELEKIVNQLEKRVNYEYILYDQQDNILTRDMEGSPCEESGISIPINYRGSEEYKLFVKGQGVSENQLLIKGFLELCIEENREKSREILKEESEKSFLIEILSTGDLGYSEFIEQKAKLLDFDIEKKRRIILIDLIKFSRTYGYRDSYEKEEVIRGVRKTISKNLKEDEYCYNMYEDKFIVVKDYSTEEEVKKFLEDVARAIEKSTSLDMMSFISNGCSNPLSYSIQYKKLLRLHKMYAFKEAKPRKSIFVSTDEVEVFLRSYPKKKRSEILQEYRGILERYLGDGNEETVRTVETFFLNDMDTLKTSIAMDLHRNTINYRLKKFVEETGIDVTRAYECMKIYILICFIKEDE